MPADAMDMLVVHRVFRREFHGMSDLISAVADGDVSRAVVVRDHLTFMVDALHHHHASEDDLVWPKLKIRAPNREAEIERMAGQHAEIAAAIDHIKPHLAAWVKSPSPVASERLSATARELSVCVDRHLDDEERNALPLIEEHLTQKEWAAAVKHAASFISPRNLWLGIVLGGLVLEAASEAERRIILSGAPIPQRLVVQLFGARALAAYRRRLRTV
ncbi:hypothetical protein A5662_17635 [Mycobacteriaceae bacterium 1482268.1]|nr:hypothetical protein A5662_17635 [Mycobacteriaceae bacterium 1482268.1]